MMELADHLVELRDGEVVSEEAASSPVARARSTDDRGRGSSALFPRRRARPFLIGERVARRRSMLGDAPEHRVEAPRRGCEAPRLRGEDRRELGCALAVASRSALAAASAASSWRSSASPSMPTRSGRSSTSATSKHANGRSSHVTSRICVARSRSIPFGPPSAGLRRPRRKIELVHHVDSRHRVRRARPAVGGGREHVHARRAGVRDEQPAVVGREAEPVRVVDGALDGGEYLVVLRTIPVEDKDRVRVVVAHREPAPPVAARGDPSPGGRATCRGSNDRRSACRARRSHMARPGCAAVADEHTWCRFAPMARTASVPDIDPPRGSPRRRESYEPASGEQQDDDAVCSLSEPVVRQSRPCGSRSSGDEIAATPSKTTTGPSSRRELLLPTAICSAW